MFINKTVYHVAKSFNQQEFGLAIRKTKEQNDFQKFLAKIAIILHNCFSSKKHKIDVHDENAKKVVVTIAEQCQELLKTYNSHSENCEFEPMGIE